MLRPVSVSAGVAWAVLLTGALGGFRPVSAATEYDSKVREVFVDRTHIEASENAKLEFGRYSQRTTTNGSLSVADRSKPASVTFQVVDSWRPDTDWTTLQWEGELAGGSVTFHLRGATDDGRRMGFPDEGSWTDWRLVGADENSLPIPDAVDGKQYVQLRVELTGAVRLTEIRLHKRLVIPDHPRLMLNAEILRRARERCQTSALHKELLETFQWFLDTQIIGEQYQMTRGPWQAGDYAVGLAVLYQLTGDTKYAAAARDQLLRLTPKSKYDRVDYQKLGKFELSELCSTMPIAYDLVADTLTPGERELIAEHLVGLAAKIDEGWRFTDLSNQLYVVQAPPLLVGMALYGDGVQEEKVAHYVDVAEQLLREHMVPGTNLWAADDGGWGEGHSYCSFTQGPWAHEAVSWWTMTGEDVLSAANFFRYLPQWRIWATRPHDGTLAKLNDSRDARPSIPYPPLLAWRYRDGRAQAFAEQELPAMRQRDGHFVHWQLWPMILWYDPSIKAAEFAYPQPPRGRHFEGVGQVVFRSGWDPKATFALFKCQRYASPGAHMHADQNHFVLHKMGSLAIDSGDDQRSTAHYPCYFQRTIAHNTILVYDPEEEPRRNAVNDGGQMMGETWSRTFGQFDSPQMDAFYPGSPLETGRIVAFETNDSYSYACGDATKAYGPEKVSLFTRQFVYLPPDTFVVFDRVTATNPAFKKTWLLHTVNEPSIDAPESIVSDRDGKLTVVTFLPQPASITKVGGPGKQWWVAGQNYPPEKPDEAWEAGAWRVEVSPTQPAKTDCFLHLLAASPKEAQFSAPGEMRSSEDAVTLTLHLAKQEVVLTFAKGGEAGGHVTITEGGKAVLDQDLAQMVQPQFFPPEEK